MNTFEPQPFSQCKVLLYDRYRILKLLGQGGFGKTFLACDEQSDLTPFCVIKQRFLQDRAGDRQRASARFQQEAQRLAALGEHPQIPQLLATFEEDGDAFIVQEWIDGWTLQDELADAAPFNEVEIWQVLRSLLPILHYLHEHQVIHRDLKPANLIRRSPTAAASLRKESTDLVLVDFGAAKQLSASTVYTGTLIGSAEYAAPEQLRGRAVFASDLYSLGVMCVHFLTQMSPFDLYDSNENGWQWQTYLPIPISSKLERLLCKLLQPGLRQRYQTAADVLQDMNVPDLNGSDIDTIAPRSQPSLLLSAEPSVVEPHPVRATAVIQAALALRSINSVTVFEPQKQTWHRLTPSADVVTPQSQARCGREGSLKAVTSGTKTALPVKGHTPIELIFSVLLTIILTSISSMTLICFFFEMERHTPVLQVERQFSPRMTVK